MVRMSVPASRRCVAKECRSKAFPNKKINYILAYNLPEYHYIIKKKYDALKIPNLIVHLPVLPNILPPNSTFSNSDYIPIYHYFYSNIVKYAKNDDLVISNFFINNAY